MTAPIIVEEFMIASDTPGISLFVRNKRRADLARFRPDNTILFVAGSTYPASTTFDLPLDGLSWMDHLADGGHDVYLLDVRGYGSSTRPPEMNAPAADNAPVVRTPVAVRDVASAAAFVRARHSLAKLNLIGWSWGTSLMSRFATEHPDAVNRLVLIAPQWLRETASLADSGGPLGAYRVVDRAAAKARWLNGVPEQKREALLPNAWFEVWADATFASGQAVSGANQLIAANGTVLDSREYWASGKPLYEPERITAPVLIVHGEWDRDCPLEMSRAVFGRLTSAPYRRWVEIGEGTHSVFLEKNRWQVFGAVDQFFNEVPQVGRETPAAPD